MATKLRGTSEPPIPAKALGELERKLRALRPRVSLKGWDRCPPKYCSPAPRARGARFDVDAVVRVVTALCDLRHTQGRWRGQRLIPDPWQIVWIIAAVFGWKHPDGTRIVRTAYIEIPRKNGKSTTGSGLAIVLLVADGELGAEVYSAAWGKDQARRVFDPAKQMVRAAPSLRGKVIPLADVIKVPRTGGIFRVLSKMADLAHGLNVSGAVIDELHIHKNRGLVDAIETGTGAREQPLIVIITTADEGEQGTIYEEKHEYARKVSQRIVRDDAFYGVVWAADEQDDPLTVATVRKCNPGYGTSLNPRYVSNEIRKARQNPNYFPTYCRLQLNLRTRSLARYVDLKLWDQRGNIQTVDLEKLRGKECYAGLDLSATTDLTALEVVFPSDDNRRLLVGSWFWLPEENIDRIEELTQVPLRRWARAGYLELTEGNVVDYDAVNAKIEWIRDTFDLRKVSHDRWQAGAVVQHLTKLGIDAVPVPQTFGGMSAAMKEIDRFYRAAGLQHGGHPLLRWCADNTQAARDRHDNVKPVKPDRQASGKRIDGFSALTMAVDGWMRRPEAETSEPATAASSSAGPGPYQSRRSIGPRDRLDI